MHGEIGSKPSIHCLPLVVIDRGISGPEVAGRVDRVAACEAAYHVAALLRDLIRVGQVKLSEVAHLRRPKSQFPGADQGSVDRDGKVDVGLPDIGVIKEVIHAALDVIYVERPSLEWNLDAELVLLVAFGRKTHEGIFALLTGYVVEKAG